MIFTAPCELKGFPGIWHEMSLEGWDLQVPRKGRGEGATHVSHSRV